ncbi:MAG: Uma2 family endonuclease [Acidobacteria bacterium]|nr:Uma2 family endonuclease [Acidobacteriota bacterium]
MTPQPLRKVEVIEAAINHIPEGGTLIVPNVSWQDYETLLSRLSDSNVARLNYDQGRLEIMSPSPIHETLKELISHLARAIADKLGIDLEALGSTTFKTGTFQQGAEPDTCFYIQNASRVIGKEKLDLTVDPPPDIAVEVDISRDSIHKLASYESIRAPEVWLCDEYHARFFHLSDQGYVEASASMSFPFLTTDALTKAIEQCKTHGQSAALRAFRDWMNKHLS